MREQLIQEGKIFASGNGNLPWAWWQSRTPAKIEEGDLIAFFTDEVDESGEPKERVWDRRNKQWLTTAEAEDGLDIILRGGK